MRRRGRRTPIWLRQAANPAGIDEALKIARQSRRYDKIELCLKI